MVLLFHSISVHLLLNRLSVSSRFLIFSNFPIGAFLI